jgi:hypothetical protein
MSNIHKFRMSKWKINKNKKIKVLWNAALQNRNKNLTWPQ